MSILKRTGLAAVVATALIGASTLPTFADTLALKVTAQQAVGQSTTVSPQTYGWEFTTSTALYVTGLGAWDDGSLTDPAFVTNLLDSGGLTVALETTSGSVLTSATITSGGRQVGSGINGWDFTTLRRAYLLPAGTYLIAESANGQFVEQGFFTTRSGVTWHSAADCADSGCTPSLVPTIPNSYFGPNFEFRRPRHRWRPR